MLLHLAAFLPLVWLVYAIPAGELGGDPVKELIHFLGLGALRLLLLTLLVSPLRALSAYSPLIKLRRPLGLWCFAWASLHFFAWLYLELGFDWPLIASELLTRSYALIGLFVWLILSLLALTSVPLLQRKMGLRWRALHGSIYILVLLACLHFYLSVKSDVVEPLLYFVAAVVLLALRRRSIKSWLKSLSVLWSRA